MNKYPNLDALLLGWKGPAANELRALFAERDEAVALWREWISGIDYPEGEEDFNNRIETFLMRAGGEG